MLFQLNARFWQVVEQTIQLIKDELSRHGSLQKPFEQNSLLPEDAVMLPAVIQFDDVLMLDTVKASWQLVEAAVNSCAALRCAAHVRL